jgi:hypothetical protein
MGLKNFSKALVVSYFAEGSPVALAQELPFRFAARIKHIEAVAGWEKQLELKKHRHALDIFGHLRTTGWEWSEFR